MNHQIHRLCYVYLFMKIVLVESNFPAYNLLQVHQKNGVHFSALDSCECTSVHLDHGNASGFSRPCTRGILSHEFGVVQLLRTCSNHC